MALWNSFGWARIGKGGLSCRNVSIHPTPCSMRAAKSAILAGLLALCGVSPGWGQPVGYEAVQVPVVATMDRLLAQEDTDANQRITIEDEGPRRFLIRSAEGAPYEVAGTYPLSNLLQELALALAAGQETMLLRPDQLYENPVNRISRMIRTYYWAGLTRRMDHDGLARTLTDTKAQEDVQPRVYVPFEDTTALRYYRQLAQEQPDLNLAVVRLPETVTPEYVRSINDAPGLLTLALETDDEGRLRGVPFVVPGGRFNEMYGWDSYFIALGLLEDGLVDLAQDMVDNFVYQIRHYGKILNANRSYFLTRSQPPFLTDMALSVYHALPATAASKAWLADVLRTAILEYRTVWASGHRLTDNGLSRYYGDGLGIPPETEPGHFDVILRPYADKTELDFETYVAWYQRAAIEEPELDAFFVHDRAVRESGHDTSYRLIEAADMNTVDLNALLYKYEVDIARTIESVFEGSLAMPDGTTERPEAWYARAEARRQTMHTLMWNEDRGMFFDYHFARGQQTGFESATTLYPLWAGLATQEQARALVEKALPLLEAPGGVVSGTEASRGPVSEERPERQWDYPNGWAPHQILIWRGLQNYGYHAEAARLAYRWLYMITRNAVDFNGTIPEKYDVVGRTHRVFAEYGNVGTEFAYITQEGFGWMNASYQVGITLLTPDQRAALDALIPPEWLFGPAPVQASEQE